MAIITQPDNEEQELNNCINAFVKTFDLISLVKSCCRKCKGIEVEAIFRYLLCLVFSDRSMYMQQRTKSYREVFSSRTVYRFLNDSRTNWERLTTVLSARIINQKIRPLTGDDRVDCYVIDDSPIQKRGCKHTELVARVWNHVDMKYIKGFRMLTLGWTDGITYMPITERLLSSKEDSNILGLKKEADGRTLEGKRAKQACRKGTDVMVELLRYAWKNGHKAKYVLFDTWFANPANIMEIKNSCKLDVIAMLKKSNTRYEFDGKKLNVKEIFKKNKKRRGRSRYLLSVTVNLITVNRKGDIVTRMPARIVYIRNKHNRKDWIALITTDTQLSEEEIIRNYSKRWNCEVFFKACKTMLKLEDCRSLTYDAHTAHITMVFIQYMMIACQQRMDNDDRSFGEIVYMFVDELADISFGEALQLILTALFSTIQEQLHVSDEVMQGLFDCFYTRLPSCIQHALKYTDYHVSEIAV